MGMGSSGAMTHRPTLVLDDVVLGGYLRWKHLSSSSTENEQDTIKLRGTRVL